MEENNIKKILGNHTNEILDSFDVIKKGVMNHMYLVRCKNSDQKFVIRIYPEERRNIVHYEPQVLKELNKAGVKSPKYIDHDDGEWAYLIYEYLPGRSLDEIYSSLNLDERKILAIEIVENLLKINEIKCNGFGALIDGFKGDSDKWENFLVNAYYKGKNDIKRITNLHPKLLSDFDRNFPNNLLENISSCGLSWLDFHPKNIIVNDDGKLSGFVDFEEMVFGDTDISIGYLFSREGKSSFYEEILDSYKTKARPIKQNKIEDYAVFRIFRIVPYLNSPLPTGQPRDELLDVFKGVKTINDRFKSRRRVSIIRNAFLLENKTSGVSDNSQRIRSVWSLLISTLIVMSLFLWVFSSYLDHRVVNKTYWNNEENLDFNLSSTPAWFNYEQDTLYADIVINDAEKKDLFQNLSEEISNNIGFTSAFGSLVYKTRNQELNSLFLIIACGLISVIGVQIRSLWDFVGNATYKNELSMNLWWPWYVLRPFIGFMGAVVFYFLYTGGILDVGMINLSKSKMYILLGLSTVVGFGLNDFIERLRMISKAVLGGVNK